MVAIGAVDGDAGYLFQRVVDADLLSDGRVVVADGGLSVLRFFDRDGRFLGESGGRGEGPGEFASIQKIWVVAADTIGVLDLATSRLSYFESDGSLVRTARLDLSVTTAGVGSLDFMAGVLTDGSVVIASLALGREDGLGPDRISVERFDTEGRHLGRIGESEGLVRARLGERMIGPLPFTPYPHFAAHGEAVYHVDGYRSAVSVWLRDSENEVAFPAASHDLTGAWAHLEAEVRRRGHAMYVSVLPTTPRPDSIPALAGLLVDDGGGIWVKQYVPQTDALWLTESGRTAGGSWWVTDPIGRLIAEMEVPDGFTPLRAKRDRVVGIAVDALGVERVEVRLITR
ncbi:MAG: 6-bladed beta-propeller [Gemmatimonadota bacterium]|nr:6-bladed beta-propeller [Gemmatimonadota bacterium]